MMKIFIVVLTLYFALVLLIYIFQDRLLFFPDKRPFADCDEVKNMGAKIVSKNIGGEEIRYYNFERAGAQNTMIIFHGNAGGACDRIFYAQGLQNLNLNIMIAEYPGYSASSAKPSQENFIKNAKLLIAHLKQENPKNNFILFGESLGTGVALAVAESLPIKALVLHTPYDSISSVAQVHYPWLPVKLLIKNKFPASKWAANINTPSIIFHGEADRVIPIKHAERLAESLARKPEFVRFAKRSHNDLPIQNEEYWSKLRNFLANFTSQD